MEAALARLPELSGQPVRIRFAPRLRAYGGRLLSGGARGEAVHAGSHLRKRQVVLESELIEDSAELTRVFLHELFHFIWLRAGNALRHSYEELLEGEVRRHVRGELGWSAEQRKRSLRPHDYRDRSRRWREYVCESFCDSAAWLLGLKRMHDEFTLAPRFRQARRRWFKGLLSRTEIAI